MSGSARRLVLLAVLAGVPCLASGCLWVTTAAVVVGVVASSNDGGGPDPIPEPQPVPDVEYAGPFTPLDGAPIDVALGHLVTTEEDEVAGVSYTDAAVIYEDRLVVEVFPGNGRGFTPEPVVVALSADAVRPQKVVCVPRGNGRVPADILIATSTTLELVYSYSSEGSIEAADPIVLLNTEPQLRDLVVDDFDGDGVLDAAVCTQNYSHAEIWFGSRDPDGRLMLGSLSVRDVESPRAMTATDFNLDGYGDLAMLSVEDVTGPQLLLFLWDPDVGAFRRDPDARLRIPDALIDFGASLDARDDSTFTADDPYPDILVNRNTSAIKVLVEPAGEEGAPGLQLRRHTTSTGPFTRRPVAATLLRLPGAPAVDEFWDIAVADLELRTLLLSHAEDDGLGVGSVVPYPLPGRGRAMVAEDLNGDLLDDLVVLTVNSPTMTVLLSGPDSSELRPYVFPRAAFMGETLSLPGSRGLVQGCAAPGGRDLFLATMGANELQVVVLYPSEDFGQMEETRFFFSDVLSGEAISDLYVADVDRDPRHGDDIIAVSELGLVFLLTSTAREDGGFRFQTDDRGDRALLDLQEKADLSGDVSPGTAIESARRPLAVSIDGDPDGYPEILVPLTVTVNEEGQVKDQVEDYVAVVMNPGRDAFLPDGPEVRFHRTLDNPRHLTVANVNGDPWPDLLLACEGKDHRVGGERLGNRVHILYGAEGGEFLESPLVEGWSYLQGIETGLSGEVESVATDRPLGDFGGVIRFVVVCNDQEASYYLHTPEYPSGPDGPVVPHFEPAKGLYVGLDPEIVRVGPFFGEPVGFPHLVIADEEGGRIVPFEACADFPAGTCSAPWEEHAGLQIGGSPDGLVVLEREGSRPWILSSTKTSSHLEVFMPRDGSYSREVEIVFGERDERGHPSGFSIAPAPGGEWIAASVVEDWRLEGQFPLIDLQLFNAEAIAAGLGDPIRLEYETGGGVEIGLDGVIVDSFRLHPPSVDDAPFELIMHEGDGGRVFLDDDPISTVGGTLEEIALLQSPLIAWRTLPGSGTRDRLLVVTERRAALMEWSMTTGGLEPRVDFRATGTIEHADGGWLNTEDQSLASFFVAAIVDGRLIVRQGAAELELDLGVSGLVACGDVDHRGREDIFVVDRIRHACRTYLSTSSGRFRFVGEQSLPVELEPVDLTFLQANRDAAPNGAPRRHLDVAIGFRMGEVGILLGNGTGEFPEMSWSYAGPDLEAVEAADLDEDGQDEIYASVSTPGLVVLGDILHQAVAR